MGQGSPSVVALARSPHHGFSKQPVEQITLVAGEGVAGDAHRGTTVKHRSRMRQSPDQPNLRQVHLLQAELLEELGALGFVVRPGELGENILTSGLDLLALPRGTHLQFAGGATLAVTGLRNPCSQIEAFQAGLLAHVVGKHPHGGVVRRAGIMAVVLRGGDVVVGDGIEVVLPRLPHRSLEVV